MPETMLFDPDALAAAELAALAREEKALAVLTAPSAAEEGVVESKSEAATALQELDRVRVALVDLEKKRGPLEQLVHSLDEEIAVAEGRASSGGLRLDQAMRDGYAERALGQRRITYEQRMRIAQGESPQKLKLESVTAEIVTLDSNLGVLRSQITEWKQQVNDHETAITTAQTAKDGHVSTQQRLAGDKGRKERDKQAAEERKRVLEREHGAFEDEKKRAYADRPVYHLELKSRAAFLDHEFRCGGGIWLEEKKLSSEEDLSSEEPFYPQNVVRVVVINCLNGEVVHRRKYYNCQSDARAATFIEEQRSKTHCILAMMFCGLHVDYAAEEWKPLHRVLQAIGASEVLSNPAPCWSLVKELGSDKRPNESVGQKVNPTDHEKTMPRYEAVLKTSFPIGLSDEALEQEFVSKRRNKKTEIDAVQADIDRLDREISDLDRQITTATNSANDKQNLVEREQAAKTTKEQDIRGNEERIVLWAAQREAKERQRAAIQQALDTGTPMPAWEEEKASVVLDAEALQSKRAHLYTQRAELARINLDYKASQAARAKLLPVSEGLSPLIQAITVQNPETVKQLLAVGANADAAWADGWTPLHYACFYLNPARADSVSIVQQLLAAGASLQSANRQGLYPHQYAGSEQAAWVVNTALNSAARRGDLAEVEWLLTQAGVDINTRVAIAPSECYAGHNGWVDEGRNPLSWAICGAAKVEIIRLFLANGADPNLGNRTGWTVLHQAAVFYNDHPEASAEALRVLVKHGGCLNNKVLRGEPPQAKSVLELGALPEALKTELTELAARYRPPSSRVIQEILAGAETHASAVGTGIHQ